MTYLEHHGVKGMKWGIRKDDTSSSPGSKSEDIRVKLKNGDEITLDSRPTARMIKLLDRVIPNRTTESMGRQNFHIKDKNGNKVGEMYLFSETPESLHVAWIGVKDKYRGHGYATASMKAAVDNARKKGYKNVTLQAIDESEDAVHIYRKMGFKDDPSKSEALDGLTNMKLKL